MPGASLMILVSSPASPLVISVSEPARKTRARPVEPEPPIAAEKPAEIDSTDTNTTTTPAIPIIATAEEPNRLGIVRRLTNMMATVCLSHLKQFLLVSSERVGDSQSHGSQRRRDSGQQSHQQYQHDARNDVLRR